MCQCKATLLLQVKQIHLSDIRQQVVEISQLTLPSAIMQEAIYIERNN